MLAASSGHTSQSLEDKLYALKYFISGQGISFVVVKATTSELIGPKKKHLKYLITTSNEPNVSIPSMVKHLVLRAKHNDWTVAFKSLITIHQLITYGNENFLQNISSSAVNSRHLESLCSFSDQTTTLAYNMSIYLRRYARYICTKIQTYRTLGLDFCRIKPTVRMREVTLAQLLQTLPIIQDQFDTLLAFDPTLDDLCNGIINSAFMLLYKDFVKLYIVYQAAIIRLLELYFSSDNLKEAREMFALYKKFLVRMDKVSDFMPVIDSVGMDKSDMPNLSRVPNLPLTMLERYLEQLESANKRIYEHSLGRLDYGTLGRPRRRSIRTPTRQASLDILSPMAVMNYKKRNEELKHLDRMLGFDSDRTTRRRTSRDEANNYRARQYINLINEERPGDGYEELGDGTATEANESSFMDDSTTRGESLLESNTEKPQDTTTTTTTTRTRSPIAHNQTIENLIDLPSTAEFPKIPPHAVKTYREGPTNGGEDLLLDLPEVPKTQVIESNGGAEETVEEEDDDAKALTSWVRV